MRSEYLREQELTLGVEVGVVGAVEVLASSLGTLHRGEGIDDGDLR